MLDVLVVVGIRDRQPAERDLAPIHVGRALVVKRHILSLGYGRRVLVAHGDVLRVVVAVPLERRHAPDAIEVALQVQRHQVVVAPVVVALRAAERRHPVHPAPRVYSHEWALRDERWCRDVLHLAGVVRIPVDVVARVLCADQRVRDIARAVGDARGKGVDRGDAGAVDIGVVAVQVRLGLYLLHFPERLVRIHEARQSHPVVFPVADHILHSHAILQRLAYFLLTFVAAQRYFHLNHGERRVAPIRARQRLVLLVIAGVVGIVLAVARQELHIHLPHETCYERCDSTAEKSKSKTPAGATKD